MQTQLPLRLRAFAFAAGVAILAFSGWASADPPSRVARLGYMTGAVSFSPAGEDDWVQAAINRPLTTGDRLWADAGARAEIQVGGAMIRMNADTGVSVLNLDDRIAQLQLTQGTLNVRVRRLEPNQVFEVDTPNLAFTLRQPGEYRIEVDPDGNATTIVVRKGQGEVYGEGAAYVDRFAAAVSLHGHRPARVRVCRRAAPRRIRSLVERSRPPLRQLGLRPLRFAGRGRLPGPRCERHLARRRDLRQRLDPESRGRRLGALPRRALGLGRPVGLDLGGRRALGLRRVPLRPLGESARHVGLGAGPGAHAAPTTRRRWWRSSAAATSSSRSPAATSAASRWFPLGPREVYRPSYRGEPRLFRERQPQQHGRSTTRSSTTTTTTRT